MFERFLLCAGLVMLGAGCATTHDSPIATDQELLATPAAYCQAIRRVILSDVELVDHDGDGVWRPGERATLLITVTNTGTASDAQALGAYPGLRVTFDSPVARLVNGVGQNDDVVTMSDNLRPNVPRRLPFSVDAHQDVAMSTDVTISMAMTDNRWPFDHCAEDGPLTTLRATISP